MMGGLKHTRAAALPILLWACFLGAAAIWMDSVTSPVIQAQNRLRAGQLTPTVASPGEGLTPAAARISQLIAEAGAPRDNTLLTQYGGDYDRFHFRDHDDALWLLKLEGNLYRKLDLVRALRGLPPFHLDTECDQLPSCGGAKALYSVSETLGVIQRDLIPGILSSASASDSHLLAYYFSQMRHLLKTIDLDVNDADNEEFSRQLVFAVFGNGIVKHQNIPDFKRLAALAGRLRLAPQTGDELDPEASDYLQGLSLFHDDCYIKAADYYKERLPKISDPERRALYAFMTVRVLARPLLAEDVLTQLKDNVRTVSDCDGPLAGAPFLERLSNEIAAMGPTVEVIGSLKTDLERYSSILVEARTRWTAAASKQTFGAAPVETQPNVTQRVVEVMPGDTLYSIARKHGISIQELRRLNELPGSTLRPGQKILIPTGEPHTATSKRQEIAKSPEPVAPPAPPEIPETIGKAPRFLWPVRGPIVSDFAKTQSLNIAAPLSSDVQASASGTVIYAGTELAAFGVLVLIRHPDNWITAYAHLQNAYVERDDAVQSGQVIGTVGRTGNVDSPQLRFEVRKGSKPMDPLAYLQR